MKITIWGCRGSLPSPGPEKNIYGGNTSCVHIEHNDTSIILDGGSGIQRLGEHWKKERLETNILLSHLHLDHIMGLGYFTPFYNPEFTVNIYGPASTSESLSKRLKRYFSPPFFPVRLLELPAKINIIEIDDSAFKIDDFQIRSEYICHPGPTVGYRCEVGDKIIAYMPDHEPVLGSSRFPNLPEWTSGYNLAKDADLIFHDGQYRKSQYAERLGWGHCSIQDAVEYGRLANVKKMVLFHHDPRNSDKVLARMFRESTQNLNYEFDLQMGKENAVFQLPVT